MRDCLPYAVLLILIFYLAYFLNRRLTVPSLFRGHWGCAVIIVGGFTAVVAMLTCYHEGWPYYHLSLIYPHIDPDKVKMSQQRVWLAFVVLQLLSITVGLLDELFRQRSRFRQKLSRMREQKPAAPVQASSLTLKAGYKKVIVPLDEIRYAEAMDNYVCLHLVGDRQQMSQTTLTAFLRQLPPEEFVRIHKSFVVSRRHVDRYTRQQVFIRDLSRPLPVGRTYVSAVQAFFQ